jgi:hypothetical protein
MIEVLKVFFVSASVVFKSDFLRFDVFVVFYFVEFMNAIILLFPDLFGYMEKRNFFLAKFVLKMDSICLVHLSFLPQKFK